MLWQKTKTTKKVNNRKMKIKNLIKDLTPVVIGELIVAALVVVGGYLLELTGTAGFDYRIITGALLGVVVMSINYAFLIKTVTSSLVHLHNLAEIRSLPRKRPMSMQRQTPLRFRRHLPSLPPSERYL